MSSIIQGIFLNGDVPQDGATVRLWPKAAFADPGPAYDAAEPGSGQVGADVTTGTAYGGAGAYRLTGVTEGDYWLSINYGGHRSWEAVHVGSPSRIIAPNSVKLGSNVVVSTTETDVLSQTLSTPPVAGQALATATLSLVNASVAAAIATCRLYIAGTERVASTVDFPDAVTRQSVHLSAIAPVAASAGQVIRATVVTTAGNVTCEGNRCNLSWVILPAASVTP